MPERPFLRRRPRPGRAPRVAVAGDPAMCDAFTSLADTRLRVDLIRIPPGESAPVCDVLVACFVPGDPERYTITDVARLAGSAARCCPDTVVILAAVNGLNLSVQAGRSAALEPGRVLSTGALPAVRRERLRLARHHDVSPSQVQVPALGGDGPDDQILLGRYATVSGIPLSLLGSPPPSRRRGRQWESTPGQLVEAAALLTEAVILDRRAIHSCGAWIEGSFGLPPCYAVAPVRVGARGAGSPLPLSLTLEEKALLMRSAVM